MCWNSGAMDEIRTVPNIPNEQQFTALKLRGPIGVIDFYRNAVQTFENGGINGGVKLTLTRYTADGGIEAISTKEEPFWVALLTVLLRYLNTPNETTKKDLHKFACAFVPLLYFGRNDGRFIEVAKSRCTCGAHDGIDDQAKFVDERCTSYTQWHLSFKMLEDPNAQLPRTDE
jgi:hypothetical protein